MWDSNRGKWEKKKSWKSLWASSFSHREKMMLMAIFFLRTMAGLELQVSSAKLNVSSVDLEGNQFEELHQWITPKMKSDVRGRQWDGWPRALRVSPGSWLISNSVSPIILCHEKWKYRLTTPHYPNMKGSLKTESNFHCPLVRLLVLFPWTILDQVGGVYEKVWNTCSLRTWALCPLVDRH